MREIQVDLSELRKRTLYIATPAYGGQMNMGYVQSILGLQKKLTEFGIPYIFQFMGNESLISRARNKMAHLFMQSNATDLLFIDSDIEFDPNDALALMWFDKPVIGAAYPLKQINWTAAAKAVEKGAPPDMLPAAASFWSTNLLEQGETVIEWFHPVPVQDLATGFMLIKRDVLKSLSDKRPSYQERVFTSEGAQYGDRIVDYFPVGIHNDNYESEDYAFCRLWREQGGQIYLCPWIKLTHHGSFGFRGDLATAVRLIGQAN